MGKPRGVTLRRRVRGLGGRLIRHAGLLPGGMADGLGDDAALLGSSLPHAVMVFFPDPPGSLYQLRQWFPALREVDRRHRVVIVLQDSRTARAVRSECDLDVIVVARYTTMDDLLSRSDIKVCLYVNHHPQNFSNLRFTSMVHANLMHGDSDKSVTVSNLTKAYDFSFVAGQAAVDRMAAFSTFYDAHTRCVTVGRPQLDEDPDRVAGPRARTPGEPPVVLYAPTWEGPQPSARYGSVDTHGLALVEAFLADAWTVIYRPHPLTGKQGGGTYQAADRSIRACLARASEGGGRHRVDVEVPIERSFADADLLICDVSGVAVDWLAVDRPLMVTVPASPGVAVARTPLTETVPCITVADIAGAPSLARDQVEDDPLRPRRGELTQYYLGDVTPGAATARFVRAVQRLTELRDGEADRLAVVRAGHG